MSVFNRTLDPAFEAYFKRFDFPDPSDSKFLAHLNVTIAAVQESINELPNELLTHAAARQALSDLDVLKTLKYTHKLDELTNGRHPNITAPYEEQMGNIIEFRDTTLQIQALEKNPSPEININDLKDRQKALLTEISKHSFEFDPPKDILSSPRGTIEYVDKSINQQFNNAIEYTKNHVQLYRGEPGKATGKSKEIMDIQDQIFKVEEKIDKIKDNIQRHEKNIRAIPDRTGRTEDQKARDLAESKRAIGVLSRTLASEEGKLKDLNDRLDNEIHGRSEAKGRTQEPSKEPQFDKEKDKEPPSIMDR